MKTVIKLENVNKSFGKGIGRTHVLRMLTLKLA